MSDNDKGLVMILWVWAIYVRLIGHTEEFHWFGQLYGPGAV